MTFLNDTLTTILKLLIQKNITPHSSWPYHCVLGFRLLRISTESVKTQPLNWLRGPWRNVYAPNDCAQSFAVHGRLLNIVLGFTIHRGELGAIHRGSPQYTVVRRGGFTANSLWR